MLSASATVALALAMLAGGAAAATLTGGVWSFPSDPALSPPAIETPVPAPATASAGSPGSNTSGGRPQTPSYVMLAPIISLVRHKPFVGKPGPEILESDGQPVWQDPLGATLKVANFSYQTVAMDFHTATYEGKPVLVWWQGYITPQGFGNGTWEIVNQEYHTVATINAPTGYELDFHEIQITAGGRAYIVANKTVDISLRCCGGPAKGSLYDQVIFEVEIKTGKIVWQWDPLKYVPLRESYTPQPKHGPWDPYHINSISFGPSGNLIVSARNTWAAYWINRASPPYDGNVFATLGGKRSSFKFGSGAHFAWQHDVRQQGGGQISLFDDEAAPTEGKQSRGLVLSLNFEHHEARLVHEYLLPTPALAGSQGNVEMESNGNLFIGWGQLPYFSEYEPSGHLVYEGGLQGADESYRIFREPWVGLPITKPSIAAQKASSGTDVYASWNGATQVASWQLLSGKSKGSLSRVGQPVARQGFETMIPTTATGPYYAVQALNHAGKSLGTSVAITAAAKTAAKRPH